MSRLSASRFLAVAASSLAIFASPCVFAGPVAESLSAEVRGVFERCKGAVIKIEASDKTGQLCGTGFFIDPSGTLLTSYSVGGESRDFVVTTPGNVRTPARLLLADARAGIAMLKADDVPPSTPFLPLARSGTLAVASPVMAIAYPMDMPLAPSFGLVSGFDIKYLGRYFATSHIRASVPVQRGQGGAPLLNMEGEVVGVVISGIDNGSACFAIPSEAVEKIRRDYDRYGAVRPGWLGVMVRPADAEVAGSSAEIERLETNAPARKAGLKPGDVLTRIGAVEIHSPQDVLNAAFFLTAGEKVPVAIVRDGKELTVEAEPAGHAEYRLEGLQAVPAAATSSEDITLRLH